MYRIYFINFGYYSAVETPTLEEAFFTAKSAGFEARIEKDGVPVATWSIIGGRRLL